MKTVDELKAEANAVHSRGCAIYVGFGVACVVIGQTLDLEWLPSIAGTLLLPFLLLLHIRRSRALKDQFQIFSAYRYLAIVMTSGYVGVQGTQIAESAGFRTGISVSNILLLSIMAGLLGVTVFDRFIARGDNE